MATLSELIERAAALGIPRIGGYVEVEAGVLRRAIARAECPKNPLRDCDGVCGYCSREINFPAPSGCDPAHGQTPECSRSGECPYGRRGEYGMCRSA